MFRPCVDHVASLVVLDGGGGAGFALLSSAGSCVQHVWFLFRVCVIFSRRLHPLNKKRGNPNKTKNTAGNLQTPKNHSGPLGKHRQKPRRKTSKSLQTPIPRRNAMGATPEGVLGLLPSLCWVLFGFLPPSPKSPPAQKPKDTRSKNTPETKKNSPAHLETAQKPLEKSTKNPKAILGRNAGRGLPRIAVLAFCSERFLVFFAFLPSSLKQATPLLGQKRTTRTNKTNKTQLGKQPKTPIRGGVPGISSQDWFFGAFFPGFFAVSKWAGLVF